MAKSPSIEPINPAQQPSPPNHTEALHVNAGIHRRSTNACRRCKRRKIKCYYNSIESNGKCVACSKSRSECLFDIPPDGVLRSHAYIATLEAQIQSLKGQLQAKNSELAIESNNPDTAVSEPHVHERDASALGYSYRPNEDAQLSGQVNLPQENVLPPLHNIFGPISMSLTASQVSGEPASPQRSTRGKRSSGAFTRSSDITVLDILHGRSFASGPEGETLPAIPSRDRASELVDTVYFYTQARYCIIDWTQLRKWHQDRDAIAYTSTQAPVASQAGAFFIWIVYAIGACLVPNPQNSTEAYFARARIYLPAVISLQNLTTVQALLCLVQYYFRAPNESPIWDLVGAVLRLCVKLRYHCKTANSLDIQRLDPYTVELRKRFFWCAYCFDRLTSMLSKLPFGIGDSDIDVEIPVDIDDTCKDQQKIRELQLIQAAGHTSHEEGTITTMTAALHHLQVYRIRSRILTNFTGPHAQVPLLADVERLLSELDQWRRRAPRKQDSQSFPQQNPDRVQANYLQAVLLLIRTILMGKDPNPNLIGLCAEFAADACESAKALSLNPLTLPDRITVYHCFYGGITLLQCLVIRPTVLTPRRAHQAISACLSALAVYTRVLPAAAPFLQLFEDVSNLFVCENHGAEFHPTPRVCNLLNRVISSDPSETSGILRSFSHQEGENQGATAASSSETLEGETMITYYDPILGGHSSAVPLEMPLDISRLYAPDAEMVDLWTESWLDSSSTEFL